MLQLALVLWASVPLAGRTTQGGVRGSGLLTGAALVTHNSSLFLLPALACWCSGRAVTVLAALSAGWLVSPLPPHWAMGCCGSSFPRNGPTTCSTWLASRRRSSSTGS